MLIRGEVRHRPLELDRAYDPSGQVVRRFSMAAVPKLIQGEADARVCGLTLVVVLMSILE